MAILLGYTEQLPETLKLICASKIIKRKVHNGAERNVHFICPVVQLYYTGECLDVHLNSLGYNLL